MSDIARLHVHIPSCLMDQLNDFRHQSSMTITDVVIESLLEFINKKTIEELHAEKARLDIAVKNIEKQIRAETHRQSHLKVEKEENGEILNGLLDELSEQFWDPIQFTDPKVNHNRRLGMMAEGHAKTIRRDHGLQITTERVRNHILEWGESRDLSI